MHTLTSFPGLTVSRFDSLEEAGEDIKKYIDKDGYYCRSTARNDWYGASMQETHKQMTQGYQAGADKIAARFDHTLRSIETNGRKWQRDIVGAYPVVPAYVAGSPVNMRNRKRVIGEKQPIRVFLSLGVSASFSAKELRERSIAVMQFAAYLQTQRPVEFFVFAEFDYCMPVVKIDLFPVNLGTLAFLSEPQALRRMMFALRDYKMDGHSSGWISWNDGHNNPDLLRKYLGATEDDIIVGGSKSDDGMGNKSPDKWLTETMEKYGLLQK